MTHSIRFRLKGALVGALFVVGCGGGTPANPAQSDTPTNTETTPPVDVPPTDTPGPEDTPTAQEDTPIAQEDTPPTPDDVVPPEDTEPEVLTLGCRKTSRDGDLPLPEASGAALFSDGVSLIVSDSGNRGFAVFLDADDGPTATRIPLDGPTHPETGEFTDDDLEGLDVGPDGKLYGLTSAGWVRRWTRDGATLTLDGPSYPLSDDPTYACASRAVNCGPNYEGLCLRPVDRATDGSPCDAYAASKARGELVCLVFDEAGHFKVDATATIASGFEADQLSDCAFLPKAATDGAWQIVAAGNLLTGSEIRLAREADGTSVLTNVTGAANQEALLPRRDGSFWSLGDLQNFSEESPWLSFECGMLPGTARDRGSP